MRATLLLSAMLLPPLAWPQSFEVHPGGEILEGEPISIVLKDAPAGQEVTIAAERMLDEPSGASTLYRSKAVFDPPAGRTLDLATAKPKSGSYRSQDTLGLFWSMMPVRDGGTKDLAPGVVVLTASVNGNPVATTKTKLIETLAEVAVTAVPEFPGAVFASLPGGSRRPAVIVLGGSEGGDSTARDVAPRLASRGMAALGLPYYSPRPEKGPRPFPELPEAFADIPVESLNAAFEWLKRRDDVDASRIALYGVSKGSEFALIAASHFSWVKAVVAIAPTDVVWEGWGPGVAPGTRPSFSLDGKPLPFVPYLYSDAEYEDFRLRRMHDAGRAANPMAAVRARIPIESFKGPLLVVGGQDDQIWASGMMAQNIAERRAQAGLETVNLIFSDAGHVLSGTGTRPTTRYHTGSFEWGGTPEGDARAQAAAFPQTMRFLRRVLAVE